MEQLKNIKETLIGQVQAQMGDLKKVNAKELGEVMDMIKDIAETEYYCSITEAMSDAKEREKYEGMTKENNYYYTEKYLPHSEYFIPDYYRDMDRGMGRMYYSDGGNGSMSSSSGMSNSSGGNQSSSSNGSAGRSYYTEMDYPIVMHDNREGRSPMKRKMYMEAKESNADSSKSMKELENYMQELTSDMMELVGKASPEEKAIVQKKISTLASKMQNV